jgi:DNA-binding NarL/FixJ family response regulator
MNENRINKDNLRVLIADDQVHVRSALRLLLRERLGVTVVAEADDVAQALEQVNTAEPDLVLLDWELPALGGAAALAGLRTIRPGLAVIALSGRPEARRAALAAGVDAFVSKGESPDWLMTSVNNCCAGQ